MSGGSLPVSGCGCSCLSRSMRYTTAIEALVRPGRALGEHRMKPLLTPLGGGQRIDEEARGIGGADARAVIHDFLTAPSLDPLVSGEFELTRRVVAAVTHDAAAVENGPDLRLVVDRLFRYRVQEVVVDSQGHRQGGRLRGPASANEHD